MHNPPPQGHAIGRRHVGARLTGAAGTSVDNPAARARGEGAGLQHGALAPHSAATDSAQRVLRQFRQVFNIVKSHLLQLERQAGVGGAQVWALSVIRDRPGLGVNELAQALDVRQPTASNLVKVLVAQQRVAARRDGPDRREVQLHLLPGGARLLQRAPGPFVGVLPQALAALPAEALQRLEQDLAALIARLHTDAQAAARHPPDPD